MWTVKIDKSVYKRLNRISNPDKCRRLQALFDLENKPEQLDIKPLVNRDCYRLRVGNWRLIQCAFVTLKNSRQCVYNLDKI